MSLSDLTRLHLYRVYTSCCISSLFVKIEATRGHATMPRRCVRSGGDLFAACAFPAGGPLVPLDTRDFPSRPSLSSSRFVLRFRNRSLPGRTLRIRRRIVFNFSPRNFKSKGFTILFVFVLGKKTSFLVVDSSKYVDRVSRLAIIDRCIEILCIYHPRSGFYFGIRSFEKKKKKLNLINMEKSHLSSVNNDNRSIVYFLVFLVELYIKTDAISSVYEVINIHRVIIYVPLSDKSKLSVNDIM